jgi:hypothetical protein
MIEKKEKSRIGHESRVSAASLQPVVGRLSSRPGSGTVMVECPGLSPRPARILSTLNLAELLKKDNDGREVLVVFANGNPDDPVIVGMIENILDNLVSMEIADKRKPEGDKDAVEATVDGERVVIRAENELVLTCGKGSITITKEGRIVVKGVDIVSRASQVNKIKGGVVALN